MTAPFHSHRAIWSFLRRTRQKLSVSAREIPVYAPQLGPVIEALATAEATMIQEDPDLPFRRGRGPRTSPLATGVDSLAERVAELEHAVKVREEHIALVAHELRGPLSPVMLLVRRLQEDLTHDAIDREGVRQRIDAIAGRLDEFVGRLQRLLDATQLDAGGTAGVPEKIDLAAFVRSLANEMQAGRPQPIPIEITGDPELVVRWDRHRTDRILRNLLSNAFRFGGTQPIAIHLRATTDGRVAHVEVKDRGTGIAPENHARIFEKHVRLNGSGFGLGLWIVKQMVDAMEGRVSVVSDPGEGATFILDLPRHLERS